MIHSKASQKSWVATPISVKLAGIGKTQNHDVEKHRASKMSYNIYYTTFMATHSETEVKHFDGISYKSVIREIQLETITIRRMVACLIMRAIAYADVIVARANCLTQAILRRGRVNKKACLGLNYLDSCTQLSGKIRIFWGRFSQLFYYNADIKIRGG